MHGMTMNDYWHWHREKKTRRPSLIALLLIVAALFGGIVIGSHFSEKRIVVYNGTARTAQQPGIQRHHR